MNMLDLVPALDRHLRQYRKKADTDSKMAAYLADGVEALNFRWDRSYVINNPAPETYLVTPDIAPRDKRPVILMGSIIYKMGNFSMASFTDGDFSYNPYKIDPSVADINELKEMIPLASQRLVSGFTVAMRGYNNIYNTESYNWGDILAFMSV
jgi:hypothetical protein